MSIQFRSRIKSTIDYSSVLNSKGTCCDKDGNKSTKAFYDCFNDGGNYYPYNIEEVNCPPVSTDRGCCCACSYVDDLNELPYPWNFLTNRPANSPPYVESGLMCDVPRCECERIGGKFTPMSEIVTLDQSNWTTYCLKDVSDIFGPNKQIDARYPRACCSIQQNPSTGSFGDIECVNLCFSSNCASLGSSTYASVFNENATCGNYLYLNNGVLGGLQQCSDPLKLSQMTQKSIEYKNSIFGSCYELVKSSDQSRYEYECSITPKSLCSGYWKEAYDQQNLFCGDKYKPDNPIKIGNSFISSSMSQTEFDELNLSIGSEYQGGIYIGVFEPGSPVNNIGSKLYGNMNFGSPLEYYSYDIGPGGSFKKWAIIVSSKIHNVKFFNDEEVKTYYNTSAWDGYYNRNLGINSKLYNTFKNNPIDGFIDYYIPSIQELHFYMNYLNDNGNKLTANVISSTMFSTKYINKSSNKTNINNINMVYGVVLANDSVANFSRNHTILIPTTNLSTVMYFRRIIIE